MRAFFVAVLAALALGVAPAALGDGAVRVELNAINSFQNPCNGEIVVFRGPLDVLYQEADGQYQLHFWFHDTGEGSFGNEYLLRREAHSVLDAPTFVRSDGALVFDIEGHGEAISEGSALNFELGTVTRIVVRGGVPITTQSIAFSADCHG
jgi:hypothetical protein